MKKLRIMAVLAAVLVAFSSCEEKDEKPSKTGLLAGKLWVLEAATVDPGIPLQNGSVVTNLYAQYPTCIKDDETKFETNGTVAFHEGSTKCSPTDPQTLPGSWAFNTDETVISVTVNSETTSYRILDLTSSSLKVDFEEQDEDGLVYTITRTYKVKK